MHKMFWKSPYKIPVLEYDTSREFIKAVGFEVGETKYKNNKHYNARLDTIVSNSAPD